MNLQEAYAHAGTTLFQGNKTRAQQERRLELVIDAMGDQDVQALNFAPLLEMLSDKAPGTVNKYLSVAKKLVDNTPQATVRRYPWKHPGPGRQRWLRKAERDLLLATLLEYPNKALGEAVWAFTKLSLSLGTRKSELLNINPETDIEKDPDDDDLYWITIRETKTGLQRTIAAGSGCYQLLTKCCPWEAEQTNSTNFGRSLYEVWVWAKRRADLPEAAGIVTHCLRHTHATALGHRSPASTARYAHIHERRKAETAKRLESVL